ncbi:MAG: DUF3794 domain-containing protein [Clostridia bacterium]|nr:DUF3794 domain-containing protein [Clostridia bacterium]
MDGFLSEKKVKTLGGQIFTQALVEGEIPFPDSVELKKILEVKGEVEIKSVEVQKSKIALFGKIKLDIIGEDKKGELVSFTSWAGLEHEIDSECARDNSTASVRTIIQSIDTSINEASIALNTVVDIECTVCSLEDIKAFSEGEKIDDAEVKSEFFTSCDSFRIGGESFKLRDEVRINEISEVIYTSGYALVDKIHSNGAEVSVEGRINAYILYKDQNGMHAAHECTVPFGETLETQKAYDNVFARGKIEKITSRVIGEEFELASVEAQLKLELFATEENSILLSADAYSPSIPFECEYENKTLLLEKQRIEETVVINESLELSESQSEAERILWASAQASNINAEVSNSKLILEGILTLHTVYVSREGYFNTLKEDIPYRIERNITVNDTSIVRAEVLYVDSKASTNGKNMDVSFTVAFEVNLFEKQDVSVISKICECEQREVPHGIIICSPLKDETLFDVGKRFNISCNDLLKTDPQIADKIRDGKKIVLFI